MTAQNTRCGFGESSLPPDVRWSTTSEPESDEVTKNETTRMIPTSDVRSESGNACTMSKSAVATFSLTAVATSRTPSSCNLMAVPPKTDIHSAESRVGKTMTPRISSRTERPLEMRAMNMPTKGDQEIHQPQ